MQQSEQIDKLAEALAAAQKEIGGAAKSSTNPHFRSKYADLSEVWATWQEVGPKNGLALMQVTAMDNGSPILVTQITHKSGQWVRGEYPLNPVKNDPQGLGACVTYARRYCLAAMVGIAPEDDDGETASGRGQQATAKVDAPKQTKTEQVKEQTKSGVDLWLEKARAHVSQMPDRIVLNNWLEEAATVKALDKMKTDHAEKYDEFQAFLDRVFDTLPAGKAAA